MNIIFQVIFFLSYARASHKMIMNAEFHQFISVIYVVPNSILIIMETAFFLPHFLPFFLFNLSALIPASEFAAGYPGSVTINTITPIDPSVPAWGLNGQSVSVALSVLSTVKQLKESLSSVLGGMPAAKQQLKAITGGAFFKDTQTLAALNLGEGASVDLTVKTRGGAKK